MRIMGLDYGAHFVGTAISDELLITAQAVEVIKREHESKLRRTFARIEELIKEYGVEQIIVGYPKNMDNSIGKSAIKAEEFARNIRRRTGLIVEMWDERLTTVSALRVLDESGAGLKKRIENVDKIAAAIILQGYLDFNKNSGRSH